MPEEIMFDEDLQVIKIVATGKVTPDDQRKMMDLLIEIVDERGILKLLVDGTRATSFPSVSALYEHGEKHVDKVKMVKTAVVISPDAGTDLGFLETVIVNRGGTMRLFNEMDEAIGWLQE